MGPYHPRMELAMLGYRQATPEYVSAATEEMKTSALHARQPGGSQMGSHSPPAEVPGNPAR